MNTVFIFLFIIFLIVIYFVQKSNYLYPNLLHYIIFIIALISYSGYDIYTGKAELKKISVIEKRLFKYKNIKSISDKDIELMEEDIKRYNSLNRNLKNKWLVFFEKNNLSKHDFYIVYQNYRLKK